MTTDDKPASSTLAELWYGPTGKPSESSVPAMRFRFHRGGLAESMATLREFRSDLEFRHAIEDWLDSSGLHRGPPDLAVMARTRIAPYDERPDDRIGWAKTFIVTVDGSPVGFADSDGSNLPDVDMSATDDAGLFGPENHHPGCVIKHSPRHGHCADAAYNFLPVPGPPTPGKPFLTGMDICRMHVRLEAQSMTGDEAVEDAARAFLARSRRGELIRVFAAQWMLVAAGYVVDVEGGCQRTEKKLPWE